MGGSPSTAGAVEPVPECGAPPATVASGSPDGRLGRTPNPHRQARASGAARPEGRMFIGIDVSEDRLDVHVRPSGEAFAVAVAVAGAGLPLAVANPAQVRAFARAVGRLAEADRLDAELIARFAEQVRPGPRPVASEQARALAEPVVRHRQIVEMIGVESNRRQARGPEVLRGIERTLAALQAALTELDREVGGQVRGSPAWRAAEDLLTSVPGVGPATRPHPDRRAARTRPHHPPPPSSASLPSTATAALPAAAAPSRAAGPASATSYAWPPSPPSGTTLSSRPPPAASGTAEPPPRPPSPPPCASSSPSSTPPPRRLAVEKRLTRKTVTQAPRAQAVRRAAIPNHLPRARAAGA